MSQAEPLVRVLLCDDDPVVRSLLCHGLDADSRLRVVAQAEDLETCLACVGDAPPDVAILDLSMPGMDGPPSVARVRAASPSSAIVVFSGLAGPGVTAECLAHGADACVEKGSPLLRLCDAAYDAAARRR
jgi:two-component system invasion response regulator UvrY